VLAAAGASEDQGGREAGCKEEFLLCQFVYLKYCSLQPCSTASTEVPAQ
jgi:hypothetical protein